MEEAEILCDRLGIFVNGGFECIANPKEVGYPIRKSGFFSPHANARPSLPYSFIIRFTRSHYGNFSFLFVPTESTFGLESLHVKNTQ